LVNELQTELMNSIVMIQNLNEENQINVKFFLLLFNSQTSLIFQKVNFFFLFKKSNKLNCLTQEHETSSSELNKIKLLNQIHLVEIEALSENKKFNVDQIEALKANVSLLEAEKDKLVTELSDSEKTIDGQENKLAILKIEHASMSGKYETSASENKMLQEKLNGVETERKSIELKYNDSQFELNSLNDKIKDLVDNINALNGKLEKNEYAYSQSCNAYENRILLIQADNEGLKSEIQNLQKSLQNELNNQTKLNEELSSTNHAMKDLIINLNKIRVCSLKFSI
jgi:chromosome segregation ATPase